MTNGDLTNNLKVQTLKISSFNDAEGAKYQQLIATLDSQKINIEKILPFGVDFNEFKQDCQNVLYRNPTFAVKAASSPFSFLSGIMQAKQYKLSLNPTVGHCAVVPYGNDFNFQLMYKGVINLMFRSKSLASIDAVCVREDDELNFKKGTKAFLDHKYDYRKTEEQRGKATAYYAVANTTTGGEVFTIWSMADLIAHRDKYSKMFNKMPSKSVWHTDPDSMFKKTTLLDLKRFIPLEPTLELMLSSDYSVKKELSMKMEEVEDLEKQLELKEKELQTKNIIGE